jgi:thiamine-phosphate pyrophosphorylase
VRAPLSLFADSAALGAPRVAIGGITPHTAPAIVAAGADLLAVIGGVFDAEDPLAAACALKSLLLAESVLKVNLLWLDASTLIC